MRKVLLSRISFSALMLTFLTFIFLFSFSSSLEVSQWDKGNPSGDQDLSTYVEGNMSAETYNETTITPTTNYSLSFDGSNDYVRILDNSNLDFTTQMSLCAWFKTDVNGTYNRIASKWNNGHLGNGNGWFFQLTPANKFDVGVANKGTTYYTTNNAVSNPAAWNYYCMTYDGAQENSVILYLNGVEQASTKTYNGGSEASIGANNYDLLIGALQWDGGLYYGNGSIDQVLIFNRSLNQTEVEQLYNSGVGLYANTSIAPFNEGLVAGYHFDEGTGTTAIDITGRYNGTLTNGPTYVDGKISHNLTSTKETLGTIGLMPWVSSTNFISTDYSLQWIGNTLKNPWFTSTELGNSTNRFNGWFWNTNSVNLNVTNQTTMNNLTVNNLNVTNGWSGNCVNSSILNGIIVGCND